MIGEHLERFIIVFIALDYWEVCKTSRNEVQVTVIIREET